MQDAKNEKSVCQDVYAKDFMDARGLDILAAFKAEKNPNAGNVKESPARGGLEIKE